MMPGPLGAHSWQPMAFNPNTGLVYIPAQEIGMNSVPAKDFKPSPMGWNVAVGSGATPNVKGCLLAWDPVHRRRRGASTTSGPGTAEC